MHLIKKSWLGTNPQKEKNTFITYITILLSAFGIYWPLTQPQAPLDFVSPFFLEQVLGYCFQNINLTIILTITLSVVSHKPFREILRFTTSSYFSTLIAILQALIFLWVYNPKNISVSLATLFIGTIVVIFFSIFLVRSKAFSFQNCVIILATLFIASNIPIILALARIALEDSFWLPFASIATFQLYLFIPLSMAACYYFNKEITLAILRDARYLRVIHYELMLLFGIALAILTTSQNLKFFIKTPSYLFIQITFSMISIFFASLFAIVFNNLSDISIDAISNKQRPLITQSISKNTYINIGIAFFIASAGYAWFVDYKALLLITACMANYWIYSIPPYRLKRIPILSKIILSVNSILLIVLGFYLFGNEIKTFPTFIYYIFLIFFTIAANVIDLKDIEGDAAAGILTLPQITGTATAKRVIGGAAFLNFIGFYFLFHTLISLVIFAASGLIQFYLINKKKFDEKAILQFSNLGMASLIIYMNLLATSNFSPV